MYRPKPTLLCDMPHCGESLNVLVLNCSLKHEPELSNTGELAQLVLDNMKEIDADVKTEIVRMSDLEVPVGLGFREKEGDQWPDVVKKIKAADIILFATPIWWGERSSLMQRVIERMDALDEEYIAHGRSALYNKVAGLVITGSEDGALHVMGSIMMVLAWLGFTLPPECAAYWVGEVGIFDSTNRRRENKATQHMAKNLARNTLYYAHLLKKNPLTMKE